MEVQITQTHIDNGYTECPERCPIALAIKDSTAYSVVGVGQAQIQMGTDIYECHPSVGEWIRAFDSENPVGPFTLGFRHGHAFVKVEE